LFQKVKSFIIFLLKSKNKHGVHSPFVFKLITTCFQNKIPNKYLNIFLKYRKELSINTSTIIANELTSGSKNFSPKKKKISRIVKISNKRGELLMNLMKYFNPNNILEVGSSIGLSTAALSISAPNSKITTLETCKDTGNIAMEMFKKYNLKNIKLVIGEVESTLPKELKDNVFDFICFNGNKGTIIEYFESCLSCINNNSVLLFNNIHVNKKNEKAWGEIKNHPKVTVTIDTYLWGVVFFRKEQQKEHFTIRI